MQMSNVPIDGPNNAILMLLSILTFAWEGKFVVVIDHGSTLIMNLTTNLVTICVILLTTDSPYYFRLSLSFPLPRFGWLISLTPYTPKDRNELRRAFQYCPVVT